MPCAIGITPLAARVGPARSQYIRYLQGVREFGLTRPSPERRHHLAREQLELAHDVRVRHAGKERPADQVGHAVLLDEATDLRHALLGAADDETVLHELVEVGGDRGVDEGMAPAARVLAP